ncbi:hypothetical protein GGR50DRAFT_695201 [Xylaria sp. CBS 124048]|nr:hypothetical protein GGR50DRAFT_695201 [Xylaria sp. CBS 124048]
MPDLSPITNEFHFDLSHRRNQHNRSAASPTSRGPFISFNQLPLSPTNTGSARLSWNSGRSALRAAGRSLSLNFETGKQHFIRTKSALGAAATAGKEAARTTASKLNQFVTNNSNAGKGEDKLRFCEHQLSRSSSSSSKKSLFTRRRLPKLKIPDLNIAVTEALNSACSTDTQKSVNFQLLELSPTSRHLKWEMQNDDHPEEVMAEYHNMLSARRRVRKGKFGAEVTKYQMARPTWDDSWTVRAPNDNWEDRDLLRRLTDAVQEQKDQAVRVVQRDPSPYPGLQPVSNPGCTLKSYWQHKSTYR